MSYITIEEARAQAEELARKHNPAAFPTPAHNLTNDGMTLRDYFAAKAMQGMIAGANEEIIEYLDNLDDPMTNLATASYLMADAMLKARKQ